MAPLRTQRRGLLRALCGLCCAGAAHAAASGGGSEGEEAAAFLPAPPFGPQANGGFFEKERRVAPAAGRKPHLVFILLDDWGWGNAGWNNPSCAHVTPTLDGLVKDGIELSHHYVFKYCSPTRSAIQSGRAPYHVNVLNAAPDVWEPANPAAGAWSADKVAARMFDAVEDEKPFYVVCPDGEMSNARFNGCVAWAAEDVTKQRPPLSRWTKQHGADFKRSVPAK